jgi:N-acetylmuramoyl-L-alanine amidase
MRRYLFAITAIFIIVLGLSKLDLLTSDARDFLAATFFVPSVTAGDLKDTYIDAIETGERVKILLVPGHEPDYGGAQFGSAVERDMNVDLALELKELLESDRRFEVIMTRDKEAWNPDLQKYFDDNWEAIKDFTRLKKMEMRELVAEGRVRKVSSGVYHNMAINDVANRLFGINRWSRDIGADVMIHIHFNDHARARADRPGEHLGFSIYVPERQYSNASASKEIARHIFERLEESFAVSTLPKEDLGIVESQDLIAIGQANTLDAASILIEYGYIYRPAFATAASRADAISKMAELTHKGILDFFQ